VSVLHKAGTCVAPSAFALCTLGSSPAKIVTSLLGLLGLAVVVYVAVPVLKTLGMCWSARIEVRLTPSKQQHEPPRPDAEA
jgi:hypothetical protein